MAETMLCNDIRQHKAVVNRHSSRSVPQDIVIMVLKEVRHIKISKHQLIKEKAKAKLAATFKGMTRCMHFIEGEKKGKSVELKKKKNTEQHKSKYSGQKSTVRLESW